MSTRVRPQASRAAYRLVITGLVLWAVAATAYGTLRLTSGQRPVYVNVRWAPSVDDATRERLEQRYGLSQGEPREGSTWGYALIERSRNNIRALVLDPAVEDTHQIDRTAFRVRYAAARLPYVTSRPWMPVGLELLTILFVLGGLASIGVALLEIAAPARVRGPVVPVRNSFLDPRGASRRAVRRFVTWCAGRMSRLATTQTRFVLLTLIGAMSVVFIVVVLDCLFLSSALTLPEDGFIEWLSALTFLLGSLTAAVAIWTSTHRQARIVGALICTAALIAFLDELGFGQRTSTFRYEVPLISGVPIDGVHDFFLLAYEQLVGQSSGAMLWLIVAALVGVSVVVLRLMWGIVRDLDTHSVAMQFFLCACALVLVGQIIDLDFATSDLLVAMEEMLELDAALVLIAGAGAQIVENPRSSHRSST